MLILRKENWFHLLFAKVLTNWLQLTKEIMHSILPFGGVITMYRMRAIYSKERTSNSWTINNLFLHLRKLGKENATEQPRTGSRWNVYMLINNMLHLVTKVTPLPTKYYQNNIVVRCTYVTT